MLSAARGWADNFCYSFENSAEQKKVFYPTLLKKPQTAKPAVLLVKKDDGNFNEVMPVLHYLRKNGSEFTCPVLPQPIITYSLFGKIPNIQKQSFESWDALKLFFSWGDSQHTKAKDLYKAFFYKLDFLKSTSLRLDRILADWQEKQLSSDYLTYRDLKRSVDSAQVSYMDFLKRLFALMTKLDIPLDKYPQLYSYNELVLKKAGSFDYPEEQVSNERDLFNNELTGKSSLISNDEINFLLSTVIENQISMASFKHFMELMKKVEIDFTKNYPAYYSSLYLKAWYHNLRSEQAQAEISSCMNAINDKVNDTEKFILIQKWIDYKDALLNLTQGKLSYNEYHLLKSRPRVYKSGAKEEHEKQVLREIRAVWNDTIQDQIFEILRDYHNYVICYESMFEEYKAMILKNSTDIVMVLIDDYDLPAMYFWFSSIKTGSIIELAEPVKEPESDNNYFKLMRGERSPFEKLLEGIGDD